MNPRKEEDKSNGHKMKRKNAKRIDRQGKNV